jgi:spermidine synthase
MGALSCYAQPREHWDYLELDPTMVRIATNPRLFRSMSLCAPHASFILGDGRLSLRAQKRPIDLLLIDAFTSDSVPIHLLTVEAMALYKKKLSPHGFIAMNISNRNMELAMVVAVSAAANGMVVATKRDAKPLDTQHTLRSAAEIAIVAHSIADLQALKLKGWHVLPPDPAVASWTDDYSNIPAAIWRKFQSQ